MKWLISSRLLSVPKREILERYIPATSHEFLLNINSRHIPALGVIWSSLLLDAPSAATWVDCLIKMESVHHLPSALFLLSCIGISAAFIWKFLIHPVYLCPLASVPAAHPLANVTPLWILWQRFRRREFEIVTAALKKFGPYVRLGPAELAMNSKSDMNDVYGVGRRNFDKHASYDAFITHGQRNIFTALSHEHAVPRRRIAPIYARKFVQANAHVRAILHTMIYQRMLPILNDASQSATQAIDILPMLQSYTIDFTVAFVFGLSRGTNFMLDATARDEWLEAYVLSYPADCMFWLQECAALTRFVQYLGLGDWLLPKGHDAARKFLDDWTLERMRQAEYVFQCNGESGSSFESGDFPILYDTIKAGFAKSAGLDDCFAPDAQQELELAIAARDTFGISFTYILYKISQDFSAQGELRKELISIESPVVDSDTRFVLPDSRKLTDLPLLNAVIHEGLRLRNNMPDAEPRLTPRGYHSSDIGSLRRLPPGIRVGAYFWTLHRDEAVFPNPETWDPSRWMGADDKNKNPNKYMYAFGHGSRGCVGQQLAMELMRYAIAAIYTNYRTSVADESEYPGDEGFVGGDCREKLFLRFEPIVSL
ncbi:hypothetical protein LMH87_002315 [Akanthomyces muscarius]|uniref:Cytochrome P450 n=1 Tax=Akanthomyces muscarius TaxID=2231603 RepID=A0A9W8Q616_AKAMU|nr:hypothetical protein LMH87_002315 [Akanthomyces muscarius]KAJ4147812.1 hypothetical protein LMH87_002315 [Akanthomyces muscarius]